MSEPRIEQLPVDQVHADPNQPRRDFDQDAHLALTQSIRSRGVLQPIRVRKEQGKFIVVFGERRLRAAKEAGRSTIPAIVDEEDRNDAVILTDQLIENVQRDDLGPLEKAEGIKRLMQLGRHNAGDAGALLGMSAATVSRHLKLLSLPAEILQLLKDRKVSLSAAYALTQIVDPQQQAELAGALANGQFTRDGLCGEVRSRKRAKENGHTENAVARAALTFSDGRSVSVTGNHLTLDRFIGTLEELLAKARKARTQGIELRTFVRVANEQAKANPGT